MRISRPWILLLCLALLLPTGAAVGGKKSGTKKSGTKAAPAATAAKKKALTPRQIIALMDKNQVFGSRYAKVTMRIKKRGRIRVKKIESWGTGAKKSFMKFTYPNRDKGVKYLRKGDNLWMYLPRAEKVVKIAGHMLRRSMMGSDFSYEDMMDNSALLNRYSLKRGKDVKIKGAECFVIIMKQKKSGETYPKRKIWVNKKNYTPVRSELYALSGRLLKVMTYSKVKAYGKRYYPTVTKVQNKRRKGTWTVTHLTKIVFNAKMPKGIFSRSNLERE